MDYNKIVDAALKKAMDVVKQSAVNFFGINTKIINAAETEIKNMKRYQLLLILQDKRLIQPLILQWSKLIGMLAG